MQKKKRKEMSIFDCHNEEAWEAQVWFQQSNERGIHGEEQTEMHTQMAVPEMNNRLS